MMLELRPNNRTIGGAAKYGRRDARAFSVSMETKRKRL
jgi:hypothetical protein